MNKSLLLILCVYVLYILKEIVKIVVKRYYNVERNVPMTHDT